MQKRPIACLSYVKQATYNITHFEEDREHECVTLYVSETCMCLVAYVWLCLICVKQATYNRLNHRSLLQNIVSFVGLFCKRDLSFKEPTNRSHPICVLFHMCGIDLVAYVWLCLRCVSQATYNVTNFEEEREARV